MAHDAPRILAGRYEVGELIGRGGMAEVHIGHDARLGRTVAIKILRSDLARDPSFQARFRREAQSAAALNHPAIVAVYDTGEDPRPDGDGTIPYIVMEYVEGHTVRELLGGGDPVPIPEAIEITSGVLDALEYSHRNGIIHRDIKPGNIMITPTGAVKVMDFGIARAIADSAATMTQTSSVVGTAQYLSPEQARGEVVDARADLYSTGCLLFELLTGEAPFTGDSAVAVAYQHVRETPRTPSSVTSDVPEELDRVVLKALAKDKDDRYTDAAHFRADLQAAGRGLPVSAPATQVWGVAGGVAAGAATQAMPAAGATTTTAGAVPPAGSDTLTGAHPVGVTHRAEEQPKKNNSWLWVVGILAFIALLAGAFVLLNQGDDDPATTTVPALDGMDQAEARQAVEAAQLVFARGDDEASEDVPAGEYTSADPAPGDEIPQGETVTVRFSSGPSATEVPDVVGDSQAEAREKIEDAGLRVGDVTEVDEPGQDAGDVLRSEPSAGTSLAPDASVSLVLASGQVVVPSLVGMSSEDAQQTLQDLGLTPVIETQETDTAAPGTVVSTSTTDDQRVDQGSRVTLYVAEAPPEPEPSPEPTQTPEPSPEPTQTPSPGPEPTEAPEPEPTEGG